MAYCLELDISSCGKTIEHAKKMFKAAVRLFIEEAEKVKTLKYVLEEPISKKDANGRWVPPNFVATEKEISL